MCANAQNPRNKLSERKIENEIVTVMDGGLATPVDPKGKLASTWGDVKRLYYISLTLCFNVV